MDFHPVEANLRQSFRALAAGRMSAELKELPGVSIVSLGVAFQMFNAAFFNSPVSSKDDLKQRLEDTRAHFAARNLPWALWICEDWVGSSIRRSLSQIGEQYGLRLSSELPGMIARQLAPPRRALPELEYHRVNSASSLLDFRGIGSVCFHVPLPWFQEVFDDSLPAAHPGFVGWVGRREGVPVCTAATVTCSGVIGLYNVATAPGCRRSGFGEAITRYAAAAALRENGPATLVLQSTSWGMHLYERMGFRTVTRFLVYNSIHNFVPNVGR